MSKIIIHNKTKLKDIEALEYLYQVYDKLSKMPDMSFCEFEDGIKVQFYQQKTCKTFYVYGGKEVEKDE
jgi:hypothetical protein